jgi:hypothetical protein
MGYSKEFSLGLLTDPKSEALVAAMFGFGFLPLLATLEAPTSSAGEVLFRPGGIIFERNGMRRKINISWSDGLEHDDVGLKGKPP